MTTEWCKENYEKSVTSHAWGATPYDAGWDGSAKYGEDLPASTELRAIFDEEMALGAVPDWAVEIIRRMIGPLPMCGHYAFPKPLLQICEAIGGEKAAAFVCGCYTADAARKTLMSYYVYCLDAWRKHAPPDVAKAELAMRRCLPLLPPLPPREPSFPEGSHAEAAEVAEEIGTAQLGKDWPTILDAIYRTLGAPSPPKQAAIRRLVHRLRWWLKTLIWDDDRRDRFQLDVYSGDARGDEAHHSAYGNSPFGDPFFEEKKLPEVQRLDKQIADTVPNGQGLVDRIESTWLCAPKAFRYLERILLEIGAIGSGKPPKSNASILQCEDTYPDAASHKAWYAAFMASLAAWLDAPSLSACNAAILAAGAGASCPRSGGLFTIVPATDSQQGAGVTPDARLLLGEPTPVKHWLVRLFRHKLHLYEKHDPFGNLVGAKSTGKRGTKTI